MLGYKGASVLTDAKSQELQTLKSNWQYDLNRMLALRHI